MIAKFPLQPRSGAAMSRLSDIKGHGSELCTRGISIVQQESLQCATNRSSRFEIPRRRIDGEMEARRRRRHVRVGVNRMKEIRVARVVAIQVGLDIAREIPTEIVKKRGKSRTRRFAFQGAIDIHH